MSFVFSEVTRASTSRWQKVCDFVRRMDLDVAEDVEIFVVAKEDDAIVACGGLAGRVLKNIALDESLQGSGLALSLMSELLKLAFKEGRDDLFLFTKPMYQEVFESCGFKYIEQADHQIILMENSYNIDLYKKHLRKYRHSGDVVGSIVMNANPFTLGHRYLVEQACSYSHWVHLFVVKEDASMFGYEDRYRLICEGLEDLENLTIHEGSDYIISKATFPTYFIKDKGQIDSLFTELDLNIFRNHLAPQLGVTHRFVGEEPLCIVTNEYNSQMKKLLTRESEAPAIEVVELKRKAYEGEPISASRLRKLMQENDLETIRYLTPPSTFAFIAQMMSKEEDR